MDTNESVTEIRALHTPRKEDCWDRFWGVLAPALVDLHRQGRLPKQPERVAA